MPPPPPPNPQEWECPKGEKPLYVWSAVPPSARFVALGMIATSSPEPPLPDAMACVPAEWCLPAPEAPQLLWEGGAGGGAGSLWRVGNLGLLWACRGREPPEGPIYSLRNSKFKLADVTPADLLGERFTVRF